MKKLLAMILTCTSLITLVGCGGAETTVSVNAENKEDLSGSVFGEKALIKIGDGLWYDSTTRIVYWWNGNLAQSYGATTPTPYYAPNGLPYTYNPSTNTFEVIYEMAD